VITKFATLVMGYQIFALLTGRPGWTKLAWTEDGIPVWVLVAWLPLHLILNRPKT
jgi:hypothetical protein